MKIIRLFLSAILVSLLFAFNAYADTSEEAAAEISKNPELMSKFRAIKATGDRSIWYLLLDDGNFMPIGSYETGGKPPNFNLYVRFLGGGHVMILYPKQSSDGEMNMQTLITELQI
ncbi:MAG: hypothetical protein ACD_2C00077G0002 [uncultured bacterium (gcode 4)]|uniref:Integron gene cassette protein n=1 Tax=uncultured bacterium (gcode 4) TaxID=1234023 RepID=K2G6F3_9BACT|nr:MAG: hypothetical protein ACD_2C00077G0002 [uncultured bacterium (gcode 4)]